MALPAPIAYWPFAEASGPVAYDASGNGHTATLNHGTWDTSALKKFGAAGLANTDGGKGASFTTITIGTTYSLAFWMNGWDGSNDGIPFGIYLNSTAVYHESVSWTHGGLTGAHHLVLTRTGTSATLYKDGAAISTQTLSSNPSSTVNTISGQADGTFPFVGTLDDLRVYNVALTGAEVAELYALVPPAPPAATLVRVQATPPVTTSAGTTVAVTFPAPPVVGRGVIVTVLANTVSAHTCADNHGNSYTLARVETHGTGAVGLAVFYCPALTATGTPFTITVTGVSTARVALALETNAVLAVNQAASVATAGGFTAAVGPTAALTVNEAFFVAALVTAGTPAAITVSAAVPVWTQEVEANATVAGEIDSRIATATTGTLPSASWALSSAHFAACAIVAFSGTVAVPPPVPGLVVTVDGLAQRILHESLSIQATVNGRDRLSATLPLPTVAPAVRQEIVVSEDGVRIFGGLLDTVTMQAGSSWTDRDDQLLYAITATDYNALADWRIVNGPRPAETLKAFLTDLVPFLYGVTLDPAQVDGPLLPSRDMVFQTVTALLDEASTITGYVWNIDYSGQLKMWDPGVEVAPFEILDSNDAAIGDITVEPIATGYGTSIILIAGDTGAHELVDTFTGDGADTTFPLHHRLLSHGGTLTNGGVSQAVGPGQVWQLDPAGGDPLAYILRKASGPAPVAGAVIAFPYTAQYPLVIRVDDLAAVTALGFYVEQLVTEPEVFDAAQAQALAEGHLARVTTQRREVHYTTRDGRIRPGQQQTISIASRDLAGPFFITDVETRMQDPILVRHVTAQQALAYPGSWRDVYKLWAAGGGGGSSGAYAGSGTTPPVVTPGPPLAHHATHEPGGADALAALSASILTSGTLPDARLSANVARRDQGNVFVQAQEVAATGPSIVWRDTSAPANARVFRLLDYAQLLQVQALDDAMATVVSTPLVIGRTGDVVVAGNITEKNRAVALGHWTTVANNPANFSALPSGTVSITSHLAQAYAAIGKTLIYTFYLQLSITGSPTSIRIAFPSGVTALGYSAAPFMYGAATGMAQVAPGDGYLNLYRDPSGTTAWTAGTYYVIGTIPIPIN